MLGALLVKFLGWLGGDLFTKLIGVVADYFQKKADADLARYQTGVAADTQIALALVNAELQARQMQAQLLQADRGWWVTAWIRPLLVYPCVAHFGAIVLDSTFPLNWGIAKLPAPYDSYEQAIILSLVIARPFEKVARLFTAARK